MGAQVLGVLEQEEAPHRWAEQVGGEVQHLEAEEVAEVVVAQSSQVAAEVLVTEVQVQVGGAEGEGWLLGGVALGGEETASPGQVTCLPQTEAVRGCLCCHLGERVGLKRRYSAFWVLFGCFWLSCLHLRRV